MATKRKACLTGGCQCGAVRYALYAQPEGTHVCHCRMCQKAVGGPFAALAPVKLNDFAWTRGKPAAFASSTVAIRDFCAACGTPLSFRYTGKDRINVTIGSLDESAKSPPALQYGIESKVPWLTHIGFLASSTTEDDMPAAFKAKLVNFQHPDHDTPASWTSPKAR
ncbi:MAG: GFA family protein [Alphaproteobacteria bacterium]